MIIKNRTDLEREVNKRIKRAMEMTADDLLEIIQLAVESYYSEKVFKNKSATPTVYERTDRLKNSLSSSVTLNKLGGYTATIGWDETYLEFQYQGNPEWENNVTATGRDVLTWFNSSLHGGTVKGRHDYWDEVMQEIESQGGLQDMFLNNLYKCGLKIK